MRKKDFDNTYNNTKPENFTENLEHATGTYTNADVNGWTELKNKGFVQMYNVFTPEIIELAITAPTANAIITLMASNMDINNTYIIEQKDIAEALHKSVDMVKKSVKTLKDRDFLITYKVNKQNVYFINPRIFCKVSGSYKQKLIQEYTKINQDKEYHAQRENVNLTVINKPKMHVKHEFETTHKELARPSNHEVHKMNDIKQILNDIDESDFVYLKRKYINKDIPTDKEMSALLKSNELMEARNKLIQQANDNNYEEPEQAVPINISDASEDFVTYFSPKEQDDLFGLLQPETDFDIYNRLEKYNK